MTFHDKHTESSCANLASFYIYNIYIILGPVMNSDLDELEAQFSMSEPWARTGVVVFNLLKELLEAKRIKLFCGYLCGLESL